MMTGLAGVAMWLMMGLMLLGVAASAIAWMRRPPHRRPHHQRPPADQTPQEILQRRYAAGEIGRDEYLRRQRDLADH